MGVLTWGDQVGGLLHTAGYLTGSAGYVAQVVRNFTVH